MGSIQSILHLHYLYNIILTKGDDLFCHYHISTLLYQTGEVTTSNRSINKLHFNSLTSPGDHLVETREYSCFREVSLIVNIPERNTF